METTKSIGFRLKREKKTLIFIVKTKHIFHLFKPILNIPLKVKVSGSEKSQITKRRNFFSLSHPPYLKMSHPLLTTEQKGEQ